MSNKTPDTPTPVRTNRIERYLAFGVLILVGLALASFIAVIIGTALGAGENDGFSHGLWPVLFSFQYYGLPLAFLLIFALLISNAIRRSRAAKGGAR